MRDMARRRPIGAALAIVCALAIAGTSACARGSADPGTPVPTFASSESTSAPGQAARDPGLPDDCATVMSADALGALFGLPLGAVALRSVRGVPAPTVGRTERLACAYSRSDAGAARLLDVNIGRYTDEAAAAAQWKVNSAAERSDGGNPRDIAIGDASAVLVERSTEATLLVVYRLDTLTLVLPARAAGSRPPEEVLVDLARRVIPVVAATMPPPGTSTPPPPVQPTGTANPAAGALGPQS